MAARSSSPPGPHHFGRADPHDNPLVLLETALGALLVLGLAARPVSGLLAATLVAEAAAYWRFWEPAPNFLYR